MRSRLRIAPRWGCASRSMEMKGTHAQLQLGMIPAGSSLDPSSVGARKQTGWAMDGPIDRNTMLGFVAREAVSPFCHDSLFKFAILEGSPGTGRALHLVLRHQDQRSGTMDG